MTDMIFVQPVSSVYMKIARRKNQSKRAILISDDPPPNACFAGTFGNNRGRGHGYNGGGCGGRVFRGGVGYLARIHVNDGGR